MRVWIRAAQDRTYAFDGPPPDWLDEQSEYRLCLEEERPEANVDRYEAEAGGVGLGQPVRCVVQGARVALEWVWQPDFFAGEFALAISYDGRRIWPVDEGAATALVRTPAYKLTAQDYDAMMADLCRWTTGWLAPAPGRRSGTAVARPADSRIGPLEYLIRHWPAIEQLVERLLERPRRVLEQVQVRAPLHAVRTFGVAEWQATLAAPDAWADEPVGALAPGLARLQAKAGGLLPREVAQGRVRSTLDTPENRLTRMLLGHIKTELDAVLADLRGYAVREAPGRMALVARRMEEVRSIHRRLGGWLRASWLGDLEPAAGTAGPTTAMLMHPVYGSLWRHYLQWRRAVTLEDGGGRSLPVERTHQLFEFWCYLVLARELAALTGDDPDAAVGGAVAASGAGGAVRLALQRDHEHSLTFGAARLVYQRRFQFRSSGLRSLSYEMRPDISLEVGGRLLLFDPKYRIGHDGLVDGLGAMHRYRDAIVGADGGRAVAGAFLLCPAPPAWESDARRYLDETYQAEWGLGICVLRPGEGTDRVRGLIRRFLDAK